MAEFCYVRSARWRVWNFTSAHHLATRADASLRLGRRPWATAWIGSDGNTRTLLQHHKVQDFSMNIWTRVFQCSAGLLFCPAQLPRTQVPTTDSPPSLTGADHARCTLQSTQTAMYSSVCTRCLDTSQELTLHMPKPRTPGMLPPHIVIQRARNSTGIGRSRWVDASYKPHTMSCRSLCACDRPTDSLRAPAPCAMHGSNDDLDVNLFLLTPLQSAGYLAEHNPLP